MSMTLTEKIFAKASGKRSVKPGDNIWISVDKLMTHDVCAPGTIAIFKDNFGQKASVFDRDRVIIIPDHYIFTQDSYAKRNIEIIRKFVKEQNLTHFYDPFTETYTGVCHVTLAQKGHNIPGETLFGTDSHTCTAGAFGMFASGIGNTGAAFIMGTGRIWVKVPETMKFVFHGRFPEHVMAKDIILQVIGDIGFSGATYKCMEFSGDAIMALSVEERMTICNMVIEAGGKNGVISPDESIFSYLEDRGVDRSSYEPVYSDPKANFVYKKEYDASKFKSVVAKPYSPDNKAYADELDSVVLSRAYVGSCTGGKITDFKAVARILQGKKVVIDTAIVPATMDVDKDLDRERIGGKTLREIFKEAGCSMTKPSCAACLGGPEDTFGRAKDGEVIISTTNRNFVGRMGSRKSLIYLASPYTVASSALKGRIADPIHHF